MTLRWPNLLRKLGFLMVVAAGGIGGLAGCKSNPVGRQCFVPTSEGDAGIPSTVVGSPALECQSRICLHVESRTPDMCTAECEVDDDCDTSPESPCQGGFVCMVPVVTGNFCCKKMCVCRDYTTLAEGEMPAEPAACDEGNAANECCNLPGRASCN